ncbi:DUF6438 domain-containing protein [Hymenobacter metallicola]|uniref:DUF6438 domain-containing protein n=1 Tax=Hymenobacter metallicola TaxID=2563114 RepID=A0A4Z0QJ19_9BACT|nr:hypothetical protein [Hymenobacter metallicola]TGE29273.1 hypothetical protein E5K02_07410 [Hymenobacter metallicola]
MKSVWVLLILLVTRVAGAQSAAFSTIDTINDARGVLSLIQSLDKAGKYKYLTVSDTLSINNKYCKCEAQKKRVAPWVKADFDKNGYTDLLAIGDEHRQVLLLIMAYSGNVFSIDRLNYGHKYCSLPVVNLKKQSVLKLTTFRRAPGGKLGSRRKYSLSYKFGGFLETTNLTSGKEIQSVSLKYHFAYKEIKQIDITVSLNGTVTYKETGEKVEELTTLLPSATYNELAKLLNYIDFVHLKNKYGRDENHQPSYTLKVTYSDGEKEIYDQGGEGSFGLELVYKRLLELRKTQQWQPVSPPSTR